MTFPVFESFTGTQFASFTKTHLASYPATVNSGDLLIIQFESNWGTPSGPPTATGYTQYLYDTSISGTGFGCWLAAKIADGSEGGNTIDINTPDNLTGVAGVTRISGWYGDLAGLEIQASYGEGSSANPDAPSLTASWGSDDNLWIWTCMYGDDDETVSSYPSSFSDGQGYQVSGNASGGALGGTVAMAGFQSATATVDPGTATLSGSEAWIATTMVVRPAGAGGGDPDSGIRAVLEDITGSSSNSFQSISVVDLPATVNSGDLLLMLLYSDITVGPDIPTGWTLIRSQLAGQAYLTVFAKSAAGTEDGGTVSVSHSGNFTQYAAFVLRFSTWSDDLGDIEVGNAASGNSNSINATSLAVSWGAEANFWVWFAGWINDAESITAYPSNFPDNRITEVTNGGIDNSIAAGCATLGSSVGVEDPNPATLSGSETWAAVTIGIRPAAAGTGGAIASDRVALYSPAHADTIHDLTQLRSILLYDSVDVSVETLPAGPPDNSSSTTDGLFLSDSVLLSRNRYEIVHTDALLLKQATKVTRPTTTVFEVTEVPQYFVRSGIIETNWTEVFSTFGTWSMMTDTSWEDVSGGPIPDTDVLRISVDRQIGDLFNRMPAGDGTIVLDNFNADYSPEANARVRPNRTITVKAGTLNDAGSVQSLYPIYSGYIQAISTDPAFETLRTISFQCRDRVKQLQDKTIQTSLQVNITAKNLFAQTFHEAGFPRAQYTIGELTDLYTFAWLDNKQLGQAITEQLEAGAHFIYCDPRGNFRVKSRHFEAREPSIVASADMFHSYRYVMDDDRIINECKISGEPRRISTDQATISWLEDRDVTINSGDLLSFILDYRDPITEERPTPCASIVTPVAGSDWTLNTESDGNGTDVTTFGALTFVPFATSAKCDVTFTGSQEAYLAKMQIRGTPLRKQPLCRADKRNDASCQAYDKRQFQIQSDLIPNVFLSKDYAAFLVNRFQNPVGVVEVSRKDEFPEILQTELMDLVTVVNTYTGVASNYYVESINHDISFQRGIEHTVQYRGRITDNTPYLIYDSDPQGQYDSNRRYAF